MRDWWKDNDSGDEVSITPGVTTVLNETAETSNQSKPDKTTLQDGDHYKCEITARSIKFTNPSSDTLELSVADGFKLLKSGHTTQLSDLLLKLDDDEGNTNNITNEQMEIVGSAGTALYAASQLSFEEGSTTVSLGLADVLQASIDGDTLSAEPSAVRMESGSDVTQLAPGSGLLIEHDGDSAVLDAAHLEILVGDDSAEVSPAGGFEAIASSYTAHLWPSGGVHLEGPGGGTVDIASIDGEAISLMDTDMCADDGTPSHGYVLRGEETPL